MSNPTITRGRGRRIKAILAGGVVLGLGAAVTLAAWNDSEFAIGTFGSGDFNLEGATVADTFTEHDTPETAGVLDFEVSPENLAPDDVVYAPFAVRLDDTTTFDANVVVSQETTTGVLTGLTYEVLVTDTFGCAEGTTGEALIPAGTALGTVPADTDVALTAGADDAAGTPVNLCFVVTADEALTEGQDGSSTWEFAAESISTQ